MSTFSRSTLFDHLPIGAYRATPQGVVFHVNHALLRINGYASYAEYQADKRHIGPDSYVNPQRRREFAYLMAQDGQVSDFVSEIYRLKTGERIWVREHAHVVRDDGGSLLYFEGTMEDITQERVALGTLQHTTNLLRNVLQTIPDRIWLKDIDGFYIACNEAFAQCVGVSVNEVTGTRDHDWFSEALVRQILAGDSIAMREGRAVVSEEEMSSLRQPQQGIYELVKTPLRNSDGDTIGVLGIARYIQDRKATEAQLRDTSEQLELALMGADLGRWAHDLNFEKGYRIDDRSCKMLGRDVAEAGVGHAWGHLVHPEDLPLTLQAMRAHLSGQAPAYEAEYRARHADGRWIWLSSKGKVVQFAKDGTPLRMVGTLSDVTQRKTVEHTLRDTQAELQATLSALPDMVMEFSADGRFRALHSHDESDLLHPHESYAGKHIVELLPNDAAEVCVAALNEACALGKSTGKQYSLVLPRGTQWFELSVVTKPTEPGEERRVIAIARNITERKLAQEAVERMAFHDSLTGLPNRRMLNDRLQSAVLTSQRHQKHGAVLFMDLDRFKQLNDTHGHECGDLLLQSVARRLEQCVRAVDTVARLGGDEFVVLIQELSADYEGAKLHAATVGHKILEVLNEPYVLNGMHYISTPSIGAALFLGSAVPPYDIIRHADLAMYAAKKRGRNALCFHDENTPQAPI